MKPALFLVVGLLLLPFVLSFDCSSVNDSEYCLEIQNSDLPEDEKEIVYATLLYENIDYPDHEFIQEYNQDIDFSNPSYDSETAGSSYIRDLWFSFSHLTPSIYDNETLLVPNTVEATSYYDYWVYVPSNYYAWYYPQDNSYGDCRTTHHLTQNNANLRYYVNGLEQSNPLLIIEDSLVESELSIATSIEQKHYWWYKPCDFCSYVCRYEYSSTLADSILLTQSKDALLYDNEPTVNVEVVNQYGGTTQGTVAADEFSTYSVTFPDATLTQQQFTYSVTFEQQPHHIAVLQAQETPATYVNNLVLDNETFYVNNINTCIVDTYNHFEEIEEDCGLVDVTEDVSSYDPEQQDISLSLLWYVLTFCLVSYLLYKIGKSQWKKIMLPVFFVLLVLPTPVLADSDDCSIMNLASCLPEVLMEYILYLINLPIAPLLTLVESLLTADVSISLFESLWSIVRYMISVFYLFFILYAGIVLVVGNANPIKRAHAKEMLQNGIFMIILIQGSFYIYDLLVTLGSNMSNALLSQIDPTFFMLTIDNVVNIGLQFLFGIWYVFALVVVALFLILRYIIVSFGVVLFPIGIFFFFIPPLKGYGKFLLTFLCIMIFVTFFDMLIILGFSMLIDISLFANIKILVMIVCFALISCTLFSAITFALSEARTAAIKDNLAKATKYVALLFL